MDFLNLADFERAAREKLPEMTYAYYAGGARDEITLRENRAAYERVALRYRVLRDISGRDLSVSVLGTDLSLPILVAPTAFHRLACPEGEIATARAAGAAGTVMILSTISTCPMEEVVAAARAAATGTAGVVSAGNGPESDGLVSGRSVSGRSVSGGSVWFQLYVFRDRAATENLVRRAEAAGCTAIVLTVDAQVWGVRERDVQHRFALPEGVTLPNLSGALTRIERVERDSGLGAYVNALFDPSLSWKDLEWLAGITDLPVLVKGIVHPEDARQAVERGAAGIVVSNHGGRQLDTAPATIRVLPDVAVAVDDALRAAGRSRTECPVLVDGGIRRGTDVIKALALGADAVCIGRPILWGLATDGERGAGRVLEMLALELDRAIALCGACTPAEIREAGRDLVMLPTG